MFSMAFSGDNKSAFISNYSGNIKMIKWEPNASSEDEFDFTEEPKKVGNGDTFSICFTKDEKYLLFGRYLSLLVLETETREVKKEFKLTNVVKTVSLLQDGKKAIIAEENGNLSILDLETLEISLITKNTENSMKLSIIIVA